MKNKSNILNLAWVIALALSMLLYSSCTKDADPLPPIASFQFVVSDTNGLMVAFTNYSKYATSYSWDFGDGVGTSTEINPTYSYADGGTYIATLTAINELGTKDHSKDVKAISPTAENFIQNGGFDDESMWTIIQHHISANGKITIADGVAVFDEIVDIPSGEWGSEAHVGMNQTVIVEAGTYQFDLDITTNGIDECWFEVWVGKDEPIEFADYNQDNNATKVLSFNAWDCADNKVYSGPMAAVSCQDTDGSITIDEAGTYYVVIRSGGFTFGEGGIIIDNVKMIKID